MTDRVVIAVGIVIVALALLILYRSRLKSIVVDWHKRRVNVSMDRNAKLPEAGARQEGIDAAGNVTARDKMGVGASQRNVRSGGHVSAIVEVAPSENDPKKV
jgi:hypothetical protein